MLWHQLLIRTSQLQTLPPWFLPSCHLLIPQASVSPAALEGTFVSYNLPFFQMVEGNWTHCWMPEVGKAANDVSEPMPALLHVNAICEGQDSKWRMFSQLTWSRHLEQPATLLLSSYLSDCVFECGFGEYCHCSQVLNRLLSACPNNSKAERFKETIPTPFQGECRTKTSLHQVSFRSLLVRSLLPPMVGRVLLSANSLFLSSFWSSVSSQCPDTRA